MDGDTKPPEKAPRRHWFGSPAATYAYLVPILTHAAREVGYTLALHGSLNFDVDLIAVPWTDAAVDAEALVAALCQSIAHEDQKGVQAPVDKPHGRRAWAIQLGCGLYIDLSVMPRAAAAPGGAG